MQSTNERALLKRAQTSAAGFGELFDLYYDRIYAYAYRRVGSRENAEDIAATVFEDALKNIRRLRWQNKPLGAWLYKIASRRVVDFYRGKRSDATLYDSDVTSESPTYGIERDEEYAHVRLLLGRLTAKDQELIRLIYFDELDRASIAALENCTTNNVYVRLHRVLKKLEGLMEHEPKD